MNEPEAKLSEEVKLKVDAPEGEAIELSVVPAIELPNLGERFEVLELIGAGGMGRVYKVRDVNLDKVFAVKVLRAELASDAQAVKRFQQECAQVSQLSHENIVAVYEFQISKVGVPFIVMDYVEGTNLRDLIRSDGGFSSARATDIMRQVCDAVHYAHQQGLIHRDIKPSNIIVKKNESGDETAYVLDFGIAAVLERTGQDSSTITRTGDLVGSPQYMSPEQLNGEPVSKESDIFSLGCVLYELLMGEALFADTNPITVIFKRLKEPSSSASVKRLKAEFQPIATNCLEPSPDDRYKSVDALGADLAAVAVGKSVALKRGVFTYDSIFLRRLFAKYIDISVTVGFSAAIAIIVFSSFTKMFIILAIVSPIYYLLFESSPMRATPGKRIFRLKVEGTKSPFRTALIRYFGRTAMLASCYLVAIAPLHVFNVAPFISESHVGTFATAMMFLIFAFMMRRRAQMPHDLLAGSKVVPYDLASDAVKRFGDSSKLQRSKVAVGLVLVPLLSIVLSVAMVSMSGGIRTNTDMMRYSLQLRLNPNNYIVWNKRGRALKESDEYIAAISDLTRSIELNSGPENSRAFFDRGWCYTKTNQCERAIPDLEMAMLFSPEMIDPYVSSSFAYEQVGRYYDAIKSATEGINRADRDYGDLFWLYYNRSSALAAVGEYEQALKDAEYAHTLGGNERAHGLDAGRAFAGLGRNDEAIACANKALEIDPRNFLAQYILGWAYTNKGDLDTAMVHMKIASESDLSNGIKGIIAGKYGDLLVKRGQFSEAVKAYERAIFLNSQSHIVGAELLRGKAVALEKSGNKSLADYFFTAAKESEDEAKVERQALSAVLSKRILRLEGIPHQAP